MVRKLVGCLGVLLWLTGAEVFAFVHKMGVRWLEN